ncbi:MAG: DinB family protein [Bacteroidetes bacterium]|nr:DinB family protein [Bacteroidota bacterium]
MKQLLQQYAAYNVWANEAVSDAINQLSYEQHHKQITSSFESLYKMVYHVFGAENIWWRRLHKEQNITAPPDNFSGSVRELTQSWKRQDEAWLNWITLVDETVLAENLYYKNLKGVEFNMPLYQVVHHVFNHSTYHRGQLITMLRQTGAETVPATDFILWAIQKKNK